MLLKEYILKTDKFRSNNLDLSEVINILDSFKDDNLLYNVALSFYTPYIIYNKIQHIIDKIDTNTFNNVPILKYFSK